MAFLLDTNILSDLMRHPRGRVADKIAAVGEEQICTSIIVTAELWYGATKKASPRLTAQLQEVLRGIDVLRLEAPVDVIYGELRTRLEKRGNRIGANDVLIAAQAMALRHTLVTDNEREFARIDGLSIENWLR
jgi:tRNA(fMet)-specific endonuclease VapC